MQEHQQETIRDPQQYYQPPRVNVQIFSYPPAPQPPQQQESPMTAFWILLVLVGGPLLVGGLCVVVALVAMVMAH